jgi:hypothetical protein
MQNYKETYLKYIFDAKTRRNVGIYYGHDILRIEYGSLVAV